MKEKPTFLIGEIVQPKENCFEYDKNLFFEVISEPVFVQQWWIPVVVKNSNEDPTFFKASLLKKV